MHGCGWMHGGLMRYGGMMGHGGMMGGPGVGMGMYRGGRFGHGPLGFPRRFVTRQERIEWLEAYLNDLRQEARAVEELLEELKRPGPSTPGSAGGA